MDQQPLVSIVTPCLNAARFIERTIESVLAQDYPRVEYIVMDGGSTDGTLGILERYRDRLQYYSAHDAGVADAVNGGFLKSHGYIFAWLSADDTYVTGAIGAAVRHFLSSPDADVIYGEGLWIDDQDTVLGRYPIVTPYNPTALELECCICQPSVFIRREAYQRVGKLNTHLRFAFDYDLWIRLSRGYRFTAVPDCLARSRMHPDSVTLSQRKSVFEENIQILKRHYGYVPLGWVYGYVSFLQDSRDQYFEPLRHSVTAYLRSLPMGSYYNYKHLVRYWMEWMSRMTIRNLKKVGSVATDPTLGQHRNSRRGMLSWR
jgi:glycosyltransferase involved in cell wall biosynthesis